MTANENNKRAQAEATNARNLNKMNWTKGWSQIVIGIFVVLIIVVITTVGQPNLFWSLMIGVFAIWGGGKLANVKSDVIKQAFGPWPKIISTLGTLTVVGVLLLQSGFGKLLESTVDSVDQTLTCWADSDSGECKKIAEAEKQSTLSCPQNIHLRHLKPGGSQEICIEAGGVYTLFFTSRMGNRAKIRFDDAPLRGWREFELFPDNWEELIEVGYFGDDSKVASGLVTDSIRIVTKPVGWRKYQLTDKPIYFEVYIQ